jgi:DNA-directed RNA polymerase I subunit RPA49
VNFPANRPAKKTPFTIYKRENEANSQADFSKQPTLIAGETGDMEFFSINKDFDMPEENYNCQWVTLHDSHAVQILNIIFRLGTSQHYTTHPQDP